MREQQKDIEDSIQAREAELQRERRLLESQEELLVFDREEMVRKWDKMAAEREEFGDMHRKIKANHDSLAVERDRTLKEKQSYEADIEKVMRQKQDVEL